MSGIIISKETAGLKNGEHALIGKLATPLKMYILQESDAASARKGPADWLCNQETSSRFAETGVSEARSAGLSVVNEGDAAPLKGRHEADKSVIEMYQYMTAEAITASEIEDSRGEVSSQMRMQMRRLVGDYYTTRNNLAAFMLTNGTKTSATFSGTDLAIPAPNGHPLFYKSHEVGDDGDTQSNIFYSTRAANADIDASTVEAMMNNAVTKMMTTVGNDGQSLGYVPDTIILPVNNPKLIKAVKQACGSELTDNSSGASNGINLQCGNWNIIILHQWKLSDAGRCPIIFESSAARRELGGNMLYTRKKFEVRDEIDMRTWNYFFSGRARLGIGHHTYKHALLFESLANGTSTLFDGQTASSAAESITL